MSVNGKKLGEHRGGYDPFTFDITDALRPGGEQELVVAVWDPTDQGSQPRGKQVLKPGGILYTADTGIWQTVWLEPVPATTDRRPEDRSRRRRRRGSRHRASWPAARGRDARSWRGRAGRRPRGRRGARAGLQPLAIKIPKPKLWTPDQPFLYDLRVGIEGGDEVKSYFGMRKIAVAKDEAGVNRLLLNDKPLFQFGPLDQGCWPDGLYTAPTDEALKYDIEMTKKLGFNMIRKHVKVEPDRWYYWCDKLGLLVWQDMPAGDNTRRRRARQQFDARARAA